MRGFAAVIVTLCALAIVSGLGAISAEPVFAAAPGPYVFSTLPDSEAQASIETTKVGLNSNARGVGFWITVEDPDGIMLATSGRTLVLARNGTTIVTLTPTLSYVAGTGETKAVLNTAHKATTIAEGTYTATLTVKDKGGTASTYVWTYTAYETKPHVSSHTPSRNGIAASPTSAIRANVAGPRSAITVATMKVDGATVPATLTKTSNTVNTLQWTPATPLAEGKHTVVVDATNAAGFTNSYTWWFTASPTQPAFTSLLPAPGSVITPDQDGYVDLAAFCQDLDGVNVASVGFTVFPPIGPAVPVTPTTSLWVASSRRNVDLSARFLASAGGGIYTVSAAGTDLTGAIATKNWTFSVPAGPPVIDELSPQPTASGKHVRVSARIRDVASPIDLASIEVLVDGSPVSAQTTPIVGGVNAYADLDLEDNSAHSVQISVRNETGATATESWAFTVRAVPVASAFSPVEGSTFTFEDVPVSVRVSEPDDGVDAQSVELYFDGKRVQDLATSPDGTIVDVSATVRNVGGKGSTTHTVTVKARDLGPTSAQGTGEWSFTVVPQTGQADMSIDTNQPCLSSACHDMAIDDFDAWNRLHWVVGDATGWGVPSTNTSHRYNCNMCHYSIRTSGVTSQTPQPVWTVGLEPCYMCHSAPGGLPRPVGEHGGDGDPYTYVFKDHNDASKYDINAPEYSRDCLYCHQGAKGTQEVDTFMPEAGKTSAETTRAHDIVGDHRVNYPDPSCSLCHSAVLTREHAFDRKGNGDNIDCETCHASTDPDVLAAIRVYPALRFRFWGLDTAPYNTYPVPPPPSGSTTYSVETTAFYEIEGERIVGGRVRLVNSTLGTLVVEGFSNGSWSEVYSKPLGGSGDGNPGTKVLKPFPVYPASVETFSCDPVERVRIRYVATTPGWHYTAANVDSWVLENQHVDDCYDCHQDAPHAGHVSPVDAGCLGAACHNGDLTVEHGQRTYDDGSPIGCTCHSSIDPWVQEAVGRGDLDCSACHLSMSSGGHILPHETDFDAALCGGGTDCHVSNLYAEHYENRGIDCALCHEASKSGLVGQAMAFGEMECSDCHDEAHGIALEPDVPDLVPLHPDLVFSPTISADIFGAESWMPSEFVASGARMTIAARTNTLTPAQLWDWYNAQMTSQDWTLEATGSSQGASAFTARFTKDDLAVVVWCYGGEDHATEPLSLPARYRLEISYVAR